jgi:hypothetical protein
MRLCLGLLAGPGRDLAPKTPTTGYCPQVDVAQPREVEARQRRLAVLHESLATEVGRERWRAAWACM